VHRAFYLHQERNLSHCNKALCIQTVEKDTKFQIFNELKNEKKYIYFYFDCSNGTRYTSSRLNLKRRALSPKYFVKNDVVLGPIDAFFISAIR